MTNNRYITRRDQWVGHERLEFTDLEGRPSWRAFSTKGDYTCAEVMIHPATKQVSVRAAEYGAAGGHSKRGHLSEAHVSLDEVASRELFLMLKNVFEPAEHGPQPQIAAAPRPGDRVYPDFETQWPRHPDGTPKRVGEFTAEERDGFALQFGLRTLDVS